MLYITHRKKKKKKKNVFTRLDVHRLTPAKGEGRLLLALVSPHFTKDLDVFSFSFFIFLGFDTLCLRYLQIQVLVTVLFVSVPLPSFLGLAFWRLFLAYLGSFLVRVCLGVCSGCRAVLY